MKVKSTRAGTKLRITKVAEMLLQGFSKQDIVTYTATNWNVGQRQTENYMADAQKEIDSVCNDKIQGVKNLTLLRLENLYKESYQKGDYKTALAIVKAQYETFVLVRDSEESKEITFINNIPE